MNLQEDRSRVLTQLGINMVVEAGAGTGKTTLLIDRLCLCVLVQQIPVEKLVALTFTDKAAAEIKTRFMAKLQHLLQAVRTQEDDDTLDVLRNQFNLADKEWLPRAEAALARLDRAAIGTIHSFCAEILKTFPLEAGLAPQAQIDTGQKAQQLFEIRWNRFLDQELGKQATRAQTWKKVLSEISLPALKAFAQELSRLMPVEYDYFSHARMLAQTCREKSTRARELYEAHVSGSKKPRALEKALAWAEISLQRTALFLTRAPLPPAPPQGPSVTAATYKDWDPADTEEAKSLIHFAQQVTPENQTLFLTAYELVLPLARQVRQDCQDAGVLSFDDLIIKTRNLLRQDLRVRRLLKEKFDILFIDEFQDTDPVQGELLLFLAEEKLGAALRWQEVCLQPGKLLVVGDPKQSIYRFRGADITAYELFTDLILRQGGEKCFLRRNFRSKPDIIETANQICSRAMVQQSAFQPAYEPIFTPDTASTQAVEWLFIKPALTTGVQADEYRQNQAECIAGWIEKNVGTLRLSDGKPLALSDIAILTRAGTTLPFYIQALRRHGLAFNTETDKDFFRKQEINDFLLLLAALADPADPIARLGVLRSPLGGLSDEELFQLSESHFAPAALAAHPKAGPCMEMLNRFSKRAGRVSLQTLVHTLLDETFFPEACAAAYEGERTLARLQQFAAWAAQYEADGGGNLLSFLADLQRRREEQAEELAAPAAAEAREALSLLTVHKSKGLEFPVVILADLSRKETVTAAHPLPHLFAWQYGMYGLRVGKISDVNLAFLEEEQKKHSRCEEIRILYVALTRAKEKLLLTADGREGAAKAAAPFAAAGLFPDGEQNILTGPEDSLHVPVHAYDYLPPKEFIYKSKAAPQTDCALSAEVLTRWQQQTARRAQAYQTAQQTKALAPSTYEEDPLLSAPQQQGAELGTVCHRALELILSGKEPSAEAACAQAALWCNAAARQQEAARLVGAFVQSPVFQEMKNCTLLACEMPFSRALSNGEVQNGVIDAVLQSKDGTIWIIDYKTDRVLPGQEEALFKQKYRTQLTLYRQAACQIFAPASVRCSALFLRTFAAVEL